MFRTREASMVIVATLVLAACSAGGGGIASTSIPSPDAPSAVGPGETHPARVEDVDIGGRSLHLECRGPSVAGRATVIFESGLGGASRDWQAVVDGISGSFRACVYDRAGLGRSDPPPAGPRTAEDLVADLSALLDAASMEPPYVFVSHSLGPWVTTLFTAAHPDAVAGLVFVDPRGPDVTEGWIAGLGAPTAGEPETVSGFRDYATSFLGDPSANDEGLDMRESEAQVRAALAASSAFGEIPLLVLSAAGTPDDWRDLPAVPLAAWKTAWFDGHRSLAAASSAGRVVDVAGSGHMIQLDAPEAVVDAVLAVAGEG